jgi:hypothetical protein
MLEKKENQQIRGENKKQKPEIDGFAENRKTQNRWAQPEVMAESPWFCRGPALAPPRRLTSVGFTGANAARHAGRGRGENF